MNKNVLKKPPIKFPPTPETQKVSDGFGEYDSQILYFILRIFWGLLIIIMF